MYDLKCKYPRSSLVSQCVKLEIVYLTIDRRRRSFYRAGRDLPVLRWPGQVLPVLEPVPPASGRVNANVSFSRVNSASVETPLLSHARSKAEDRPALFFDFAQTLAVFILRSACRTRMHDKYLSPRDPHCITRVVYTEREFRRRGESLKEISQRNLLFY